jgi:hypothetical protein
LGENLSLFAMPQLREIDQQLEITAPLIVFFGLPEKEQLAVLPFLEERKYDFPDGDLVTSNALEILINAYKACLNSISIRLVSKEDQAANQSPGDLADLIDRLLETAYPLSEDFETSSDASCLRVDEWSNLRRLSLVAQQQLNIQLAIINMETMRNCVEYWLHT